MPLNRANLPAEVKKRDGRLVPFDADKISQGLFAATEECGQADAFLSRELTDGVLHFLGAEIDTAQATSDEIAEVVVKVTRELGHPELARAFAKWRERRRAAPEKAPEQPAVPFALTEHPADVASRARQTFERRAVYTRDLVSAMDQGLLRGCLTGDAERLEHVVLDVAAAAGGPDLGLNTLVDLQAQSRGFVLTGADRLLDPADAGAWVRNLSLLARALPCRIAVALQARGAPRAKPGAGLPLFGVGQAPPEESDAAAWAIVDAAAADGLVHIDWHIHEEDLTEERGRRMSAAMLRTPGLALRLDSPLPYPACLMRIGLGLDPLLDLPDIECNIERYLDKLASLVSMAVSAAAQKRKFLLRALPRDSRLLQGFLLHRAVVELAPCGLTEVVARLVGRRPAENAEAVELGRLILNAVVTSAKQHGVRTNVDTVVTLDWPAEAGASTKEAVEGHVAAAQRWAESGARLILRLPESLAAASSLLRFLARKTRVAGLALVRTA